MRTDIVNPFSKRIEFAWELGGNTGHVATLLPIARAMKSRGYDTRFLLRFPGAGLDLEGSAEIPREGAPVWNGPALYPNPLNFGEILLNFGYHEPASVKALVDAWRERLWLSHAVIASVAPAAHLAARTLGIPSFEISQGFHMPPPGCRRRPQALGGRPARASGSRRPARAGFDQPDVRGLRRQADCNDR